MHLHVKSSFGIEPFFIDHKIYRFDIFWAWNSCNHAMGTSTEWKDWNWNSWERQQIAPNLIIIPAVLYHPIIHHSVSYASSQSHITPIFTAIFYFNIFYVWISLSALIIHWKGYQNLIKDFFLFLSLNQFLTVEQPNLKCHQRGTFHLIFTFICKKGSRCITYAMSRRR